MTSHTEDQELREEDNIDEYGSTLQLFDKQHMVAYKRRWLMLLIFSLNCGLCAEMAFSLNAVNTIVNQYYDMPSTSIEWLSNMCFLFYIVLCVPMTYAINRFGIRKVLLFAALCDVLAALMKYIGHNRDRFAFLVIGQIFTGFAYSSIMQMPGKVSSMWFPEQERAKATSIGVLSNPIGFAIGYLHPTLTIKAGASTKNDLKIFFCIQLVEAILFFVATTFYQEKPPTAASVSSDVQEKIGFKDSLKALCQNRNYVILVITYGIMLGLLIAIAVLLNPLVAWFFPTETTSIGMMGFWSIIASIVSGILVGWIIDKYWNYKTMAIILLAGSCISWLIFILFVIKFGIFSAAYATYIVVGVFIQPFISMGIEQAAEITYPVPEESSTMIMTLMGNAFGFVNILVFGAVIEAGYLRTTTFVVAGSLFIALILAICTKTELKRLQASEEN